MSIHDVERFNRFYQPDVDLEALEVRPDLELSTPSEIRLPLLWIALLRNRLQASLAATTGVERGGRPHLSGPTTSGL